MGRVTRCHDRKIHCRGKHNGIVPQTQVGLGLPFAAFLYQGTAIEAKVSTICRLENITGAAEQDEVRPGVILVIRVRLVEFDSRPVRLAYANDDG